MMYVDMYYAALVLINLIDWHAGMLGAHISLLLPPLPHTAHRIMYVYTHT